MAYKLKFSPGAKIIYKVTNEQHIIIGFDTNDGMYMLESDSGPSFVTDIDMSRSDLIMAPNALGKRYVWGVESHILLLPELIDGSLIDGNFCVLCTNYSPMSQNNCSNPITGVSGFVCYNCRTTASWQLEARGWKLSL